MHPRVRAHVRQDREQVGEGGRPLAKRADDQRAHRRARIEVHLHRAHLARLHAEELLVKLGARAPPLAADGGRPPLSGLAAARVRLALARGAVRDRLELAQRPHELGRRARTVGYNDKIDGGQVPTPQGRAPGRRHAGEHGAKDARVIAPRQRPGKTARGRGEAPRRGRGRRQEPPRARRRTNRPGLGAGCRCARGARPPPRAARIPGPPGARNHLGPLCQPAAALCQGQTRGRSSASPAGNVEHVERLAFAVAGDSGQMTSPAAGGGSGGRDT